MPEMWARCEPCNRYFFVPSTTGEEMSRTLCPVCCEAPDRFEVRTGKTSFDLSFDDIISRRSAATP